MRAKEKVLIYSDYWSNLGGGEKYAAFVADTLAESGEYDVTLLASDSSVTSEKLCSYFNLRLKNVGFEVVRRDRIVPRLRDADTAIIVSNFRAFGTPGRRTVYILQVPYGPLTPISIATKALRGDVKDALKDCLRIQLMRDARRAGTVLVYSHFVRETLLRHHHLDAKVLYPPIDDFAADIPKQQVVLSVGRFFSGLYNNKRYDILIEAFKQLSQQFRNASWEYRLVGSCASDNTSQRYLAELRKQARGYPISFHVNSPYGDLLRHYGEATLFWHGTGFGSDDGKHPERMEHFGMTTVEAMSAQCVPIVINKGGQKEIVSHGESGYLWSTLDELVDYSIDVIRNPDLLSRLQRQARSRYRDFDRKQFSHQLLTFIQELTSHGKE